MKLKLITSAIAACALITGPAMADPPKHKKHKRSGSVAAGAAVAGPQGAAAVGGAGSASTMPGMTRETRRSGTGADATMRTRTTCIPNSVATTSSNTAYADRNSASGASTTSGTAQGSGEVASSSDGYATAERSQEMSWSDASGGSVATARPSRRC